MKFWKRLRWLATAAFLALLLLSWLGSDPLTPRDAPSAAPARPVPSFNR